MKKDSISNVELENTQDIQDKPSNIKSAIKSIALFLLMMVVAFGIWFYAKYLEDPMMEKCYHITFELQDANEYEFVVILNQDMDISDSKKI